MSMCFTTRKTETKNINSVFNKIRKTEKQDEKQVRKQVIRTD